MTMPYYRLMGQIFVATETWDDIPDVMEAMSKVGLTKDEIDEGRSLVEQGEKLVERRRKEAGGERIAAHGVHTACEELEMWVHSAKANLRRRVDDPEVTERAIGHGLHAHDHTVSVIAGVFRTLGVLRTDPRVRQGYERQQSLKDLIVRGSRLLAKLFDCTVSMVGEISTSRRSDVFSELRDHQNTMEAWVVDLANSAEQLGDQPEILGLVGYLPEGVGIPMGGSSFAVPLHQRAQHDEIPDPDETGPTAGWSAGRQGRNRENMGEGFVNPKFD